MSFFSRTICVSPSSIRYGAARITNISDSLVDCFDQLNNAANAVRGNSWIGKDKTSFDFANSSNQIKFRKTAVEIAQIADELRSYADVMENTDKEQAAIIRSVG